MSPEDARILRLRADCNRDWESVRLHSARASSAAPTSLPFAAYVALSLDHAYQAFETILVRIETNLGKPPRQIGDGWHRALLADAARPVPGLRPAFCPPESEADWKEILGFRHFLRHAYAVELDGAILAERARQLARAVEATDPMVRELIGALV